MEKEQILIYRINENHMTEKKDEAAVTDSAVKLAKEKGVTRLGFVRKDAGNLYHEGAVKIRTLPE